MMAPLSENNVTVVFAVGGLVASTAVIGLLSIPSAYATANCDKADREDNVQGFR